MSLLNRLIKEEEGQGLAEYALILVLISVAAIIAMTALGGKISEVFDEITGELQKHVT